MRNWGTREAEELQPAPKSQGFRGSLVTTERYEEGLRIISVGTEEEFLEALNQMTNYRVAIEAPEAIMEAYGIGSALEFGIEPDDLGFPAKIYERSRWN